MKNHYMVSFDFDGNKITVVNLSEKDTIIDTRQHWGICITVQGYSEMEALAGAWFQWQEHLEQEGLSGSSK